MSSGAELLRVQGVDLGYGDRLILAGADLEVRQAEVIGITGPNGSGKSTLLNVISGWHRCKRGSIRLAGRQVSRWSPDRIARCGVRRSFQGGLVLETGDVTVQMTLSRLGASVLDLKLLLGRRRLDAALGDAARDVAALSARGEAGATVPLGRSLMSLSGGLRRLADTFSALYGATALCLLDEPFSGLDDDHQGLVQNAIGAAAAAGTGVIVVDHNLARLRATANAVYHVRTTSSAPASLVRA